MSSSTVRLNCSAAGDPQPIISWRKQGGQLPVERSQQINGALVIRNFQQSDAGNYICTATSASVFDVEAVTTLEMQRGRLVIMKNYYVSSYDDDRNLRIISGAISLNSYSFQSLRQEILAEFTQETSNPSWTEQLLSRLAGSVWTDGLR